jgi:hypothetical protein
MGKMNHIYRKTNFGASGHFWGLSCVFQIPLNVTSTGPAGLRTTSRGFHLIVIVPEEEIGFVSRLLPPSLNRESSTVITLSMDERTVLERLSRLTESEARKRFRAVIVLLEADGLGTREHRYGHLRPILSCITSFPDVLRRQSIRRNRNSNRRRPPPDIRLPRSAIPGIRKLVNIK